MTGLFCANDRDLIIFGGSFVDKTKNKEYNSDAHSNNTLAFNTVTNSLTEHEKIPGILIGNNMRLNIETETWFNFLISTPSLMMMCTFSENRQMKINWE